jgi:hypothetical protein
MLQTALTCHRSGDLEQADAIYAEIVAMDPANSEVAHLLGMVAHQKGEQSSDAAPIGGWKHIEPLPRQPIYAASIGGWKHIEPRPQAPAPEAAAEAMGDASAAHE